MNSLLYVVYEKARFSENACGGTDYADVGIVYRRAYTKFMGINMYISYRRCTRYGVIYVRMDTLY